MYSGDELRQKIETEQSEIGRLHQEIAELKSIREDLYDSDEISSDSSEDIEDEDDLLDMLKELTLKNQQLEACCLAVILIVITVLKLYLSSIKERMKRKPIFLTFESLYLVTLLM